MDIDQILDECIQEIMDGSATLEECLREYPAEMDLGPLLHVALMLAPQGLPHPPRAYQERARARMNQYLHAHPHGREAPGEQKGSGEASSSQERDQTLSLGLG